MQAYRLVVGPDRSVVIPDGVPGQIVTVLIDESWQLTPSASLKPLAEMSHEEQDRLKMDFLDRGRRVRSRLSDQSPIDHGAVIYGEDGLPW